MRIKVDMTDGSKRQLEQQNGLIYNELSQQQVTVVMSALETLLLTYLLLTYLMSLHH